MLLLQRFGVYSLEYEMENFQNSNHNVENLKSLNYSIVSAIYHFAF